MARAFATNQQITGTTTLARNQSKLTLAGWIRRPSSGSIQNWGFVRSGANPWWGIIHSSDNNIYFAHGISTWRRVLQNITGWNHIAYVFDGTLSAGSRITAYVNGTSQTLNGTNPGTTTSDNINLENFGIGRDGSSNNTWSSGDFADLGIWQAALTAAEVSSLSKGMTCDKILPQSLVTYIPLVRDIQDLARGMTLTDTNSTVAAHPRVYA
jgi:hypothetical protein